MVCIYFVHKGLCICAYPDPYVMMSSEILCVCWLLTYARLWRILVVYPHHGYIGWIMIYWTLIILMQFYHWTTHARPKKNIWLSTDTWCTGDQRRIYGYLLMHDVQGTKVILNTCWSDKLNSTYFMQSVVM